MLPEVQARAEGETAAGPADGFVAECSATGSKSDTVAGSTVFDTALRYQVDPWRFALDVENLADKTSLAPCSDACFYGDERNFTLPARYSW